MPAQPVTLIDLCAFDPDKRVGIRDFEDIIGRRFRQPGEGLGADNTPAWHMGRTLLRPANAF